jgi:uncharacterized small protein (DUF1192 family)
MSDSLEASMMKRIGELKAENARLKADVNELADGLKLASEVGIKMADEVTRLKAEVERLTKAGDVMASGLQGMAGERPKALADEWNDAKGVNP